MRRRIRRRICRTRHCPGSWIRSWSLVIRCPDRDAGLSDRRHILRRVVDKLPCAIRRGGIVDLDGVSVDLARHTDDVSADYGSICSESRRLLRRRLLRRRVCCLRTSTSRRLRLSWRCATRSFAAGVAARGSQRRRGCASLSSARPRRRRCGKYTSARIGFDASNDLPCGPNIEQPPGAIHCVHGLLVGLAHVAHAADARLDEVIQGSREAAVLPKKEAHAARVLLAPPDQLVFLFAAPLREKIDLNRRRRDDHERGHKHHHQQRIPRLRPPSIRLCFGFHHPAGPCCSIPALARRPELISSKSNVVLLIRNTRYFPSSASPSSTIITSSPLVKHARR